MATTRHWTINSANDDHRALVGPEEQHVLIARRVAAIEGKLETALEASEARQSATIERSATLLGAELGELRAGHSDDLRLLRDSHRADAAALATAVAGARGTTEQAHVDVVARVALAETELMRQLGNIEQRRQTATVEAQERHADTIEELRRMQGAALEELRRAHEAEMAQTRVVARALELTIGAKDAEIVATGRRLTMWSLASLGALFLSGAAVATAAVWGG